MIVERGRDVQFGAQILVAAIAGQRADRPFGKRPLADQIDAAGRIAGAAEQPRGTAQHLHPVVQEQVGHDGGKGERECRDAVDKIVVDGEPARQIGRVLAANAGDGDAVRDCQRVLEREQVALLQQFLVDHGNGVRHVLERGDGLADRLTIALADDDDVVLTLAIGVLIGRRYRLGRGGQDRQHHRQQSRQSPMSYRRPHFIPFCESLSICAVPTTRMPGLQRYCELLSLLYTVARTTGAVEPGDENAKPCPIDRAGRAGDRRCA